MSPGIGGAIGLPSAPLGSGFGSLVGVPGAGDSDMISAGVRARQSESVPSSNVITMKSEALVGVYVRHLGTLVSAC